MPQRQGTRTIDSKEVQGEGSWVEMRRPKGRDIKEAMRKSREDAEDAGGMKTYTDSMDLLRAHTLEWNWVDDNGKPLAQPTDPDVFDELTDDEIRFLSEHLTENPSAKN